MVVMLRRMLGYFRGILFLKKTSSVRASDAASKGRIIDALHHPDLSLDAMRLMRVSVSRSARTEKRAGAA